MTALLIAPAYRAQQRSPTLPPLCFTVLAPNKEAAQQKMRGDTNQEIVFEEVLCTKGSPSTIAWRTDITLDGWVYPWDLTVLAPTRQDARDICLQFMVGRGQRARAMGNDTILAYGKSGYSFSLSFAHHKIIE